MLIFLKFITKKEMLSSYNSNINTNKFLTFANYFFLIILQMNIKKIYAYIYIYIYKI